MLSVSEEKGYSTNNQFGLAPEGTRKLPDLEPNEFSLVC